MSSTSEIGTQIRIVFQTNFPTFTPDQISKILKEREYTAGQSRMINPINPQISSVIPLFSKENINIMIFQPANQIIFSILNTLNLESVYEEINTILSLLRIIQDVILNINFYCVTRSKVEHEPQIKMTSLLKEKFLEDLSSELGEPLRITSIRLSTSFPTQEGLQIILEPLINDPEDHYYINISYQTKILDEFNTFIERFGNELIKKIIDEIEKIG